MSKILKEPLLHFFIAGAALYAWIELSPGVASFGSQIVISKEQVRGMEDAWRQRWRREPSGSELQNLIDAEVRQEMLYREALRLGLDRDDAVIRNRLIQKLLFLKHEGSAEPGEAELEAYFLEHRERYADTKLWDFEQVYLGQTISDDEAAKILYSLNAGEGFQELESSLTDVPSVLSDASYEQIESHFGRIFADTLAGLKQGSWSSPIVSGYGLHAVKVNRIQVVPFNWRQGNHRKRLSNDWLSDQAAAIEQDFMQNLRKRYEVSVESAAD